MLGRFTLLRPRASISEKLDALEGRLSVVRFCSGLERLTLMTLLIDCRVAAAGKLA